MPLKPVVFTRLAALAALALGLSAGCGMSEKSAAELDASELLALFQERQHVDAKNFVEADLGRFRVVHKLADGEGQLYVQFHLFGILPQDRQARLAQRDNNLHRNRIPG